MSMRKRTPTAVIMLTLVFIGIQYAPRIGFFIIIQGIVLASLVEFYNLARKKDIVPRRMLGFVISLIIGFAFLFRSIPFEVMLFSALLAASIYYVLAINRVEKLVQFPTSITTTFFGAVYLSFTLNHFILLREDWGPFYIYFMMIVIFVGDTGAYLIGKMIGKHKLAPMASPKKTWEGSFAGIITGCLGGLGAYFFLLRENSLWKALLLAFLIHLVAQFSDPLESLFKRGVGVKDSSNMLPGHGGFLDRVDSLILATPLFYYLLKYLGMK